MYSPTITCFSVLLLFCSTVDSTHTSSPYLSPNTIFPNYQNMVKTLKIFIYAPEKPFSFATPHESLFYSSLLNSSFLTQNPEQAHLFFVPFPSHLSTRSISRVIRGLRTDFPYWNRTLGADHFYVSCAGIGYESDRNLVELKKNSVQISCFPTPVGNFIPHKDITLPPLNPSPLAYPIHAPSSTGAKYLGYVRHYGGSKESTLAEQLMGDPEFLVESEPCDPEICAERLASSEYCLFDYGSDMSGIRDALRFGCVPVVVVAATERPIQDLPFIDVLTWRDMAVFVGGGGEEVKRVLLGRARERVRRGVGAVASQHFTWNETPKPYDAFHTVLYQLWLRRHTIRYARRDGL